MHPATPAPTVPVINPTGLAGPQLAGEACASCSKSYPRPSVLVGRTPSGAPLYVCQDHGVSRDAMNDTARRP